MKQYIRLDPIEEIPRKNKPRKLSEEEKNNRLYALAKKLNVKIQK